MRGAVRPHAARLVVAAVAAAAAELCGLGLVAAAAWLIARASQRPELAALSVAVVAVRGFALAKGALRYAERLAGHDAALRALAELRGRVFDALAASPRHSSTAPGADGGRGRDGEALTRLVSDVDAVQDLLLRCALPAVAAAVCGAAGAVVCWAVLPVAGAVLAGGLVVAGVVVPVAAAVLGGRASRRAVSARDALAVRALDVLEGARDLAMFGAAGRFAGAAREAAARLERAERAAARLGAAVAAAGYAVQGVTAALVVWAATRPAAAARGVDEVGAAVLALTALVAVEAVLPLGEAARRLREVRPAARRTGALLRTSPPATPPPPAPAGGDAEDGPVGGAAVELRGVTLTYPGGTAPALDGVDLRVEPGRRVAVVGASGAGKSTLLAVLSGEAAASSGTVRVGGRPASPGGAGGTVRGLAQDAHVFAATVGANLRLARPDAGDAELREAAERAGLWPVVRDLPEGWDTPVGAGGRGLSGGQRQRLLLARALLAAPPVLVLDEPAEALDPVMADRVVADLLAAPGGGTVLLVTHRLAALEAADEVLVMDRGRIVQRGRHAALLAAPGAYRDLWDAELLTT
ncbi:thiol reductant ABC exporter subunit CydC [Actinomadura sp. NEAU-AAG5]|uniref:Thiol reductant ABC exporter subunit CydC n=2 Tax=Actinomadura litoris TaxID=2678616 RepID=A0A7K1KZF0_9ACTN|nr:thiol reductant ABC exporter subunit CydC [Actinomadura litoris]